MKKSIKRGLRFLLPLMLAVMVVAGCMADSVSDGNTGSINCAAVDVTGRYNDLFSALTQANFSGSVLKTEATYETRTVIISLSQESLRDYAGQGDIASYAASEEGQEKTRLIYAQQDKLLRTLQEYGIDYELEYRYAAIDNAIAVTIDTSYVSLIKKMDNVDSVILSRVYAVPQTVDGTDSGSDAVTNTTSVYGTGVYDSSDALADGLDGSGMLVAILDTGLDYTHSAFQNMPDASKVAWDKETVAALLESKPLKAEELYTGGTLTVDNVFYNLKVPFMFDYADKDADVYPSYSNHGTHVAGIVAGHDTNGYTDKDGNHVDEDFWGVAPEAQLVICKVFSDNIEGTNVGGAESEDILAALEDCVLLGVDVINMSLGTSAGFTSADDGDDEGAYMNRVYNAIGEAGISLVCAASNDYSAGYGSVFGTNLSGNPDSGVVGSPSTYASALSVASISGKMSNYLLANGTNAVFFLDSNDANSNPYDFVSQMLTAYPDNNGVFEYVVVPGVGLASDYTSKIKELVKGRIALVQRGDSSFQEKVEVAMSNGAIGVIVYNNVAGSVRMTIGDIDDPIPTVSVTMKSGQTLVNGAVDRVGTVQISTNYQAGPFMSDFSSLGCTTDLKLKPEITAHGGEITSTVPGGYGEQSGTSMASPNMAGVVALLRSYVQNNVDLDAIRATYGTPDDSDAVIINRLVNQLLMSTATTVYDADNLPYSPRKQGAGLGSLDNARFSSAFLWTTVAADYRPKYELGDDADKVGQYEITFYVTNFGETALNFETCALFMTETLSVDGLAVAEQAYMLTDIPAQWYVNDVATDDGAQFSVSAGETCEIRLTLTLSDEEKQYIDRSFENGMFVEGFAKLLSTDEEQCDLVLPFMGFYGDWTAAPMLDYDAYELAEYQKDLSIADDEKPQASVYATHPAVKYMDGLYTLPMGSFVYLQDENAEQIYAEMEHNVISCYNDYFGDRSADTYVTSYQFYGLYTGLLRSARYVDYVLYNADTGEILEQDTVSCVGKAYAGNGSTVPGFVKLETDPAALGLVSGEKYVMSFDFYLDYENEDRSGKKETYEFYFYADYEAPIVEDVRVRYYEYKDGSKTKQKIYLDIDVYDNLYAQSVMLTYLDSVDQTLKMVTEYVTPVLNANKNGTTTVTIEVTDFYDQYKNNLYIQVDDYGMNTSQYWLDLSEANKVLAPESFTLPVTEQTVALDIYETHTVTLEYAGEGTLSNFEWYSSDCSVANVKNGQIVGLSAGTATITVVGKNGQQESVHVTVSDRKRNLSIPAISFEVIVDGDGKLSQSTSYANVYPGASFRLNINTDPWYYPTEELVLKWESTNEKVAQVDQNGNVTTLAEGVVTIKAIIVVDGSPTAYTATMTLNVQDPFVVSGVTLTEYHGVGGVVEIPTDKNIMIIGDRAFEDNNTITEIIIPESVMQINEEAFLNCTALEAVYFVSKEAQSIADADISLIYQSAFAGCTSLKLVDLTNVKIVTIGRECFSGCTSLTEIRQMHKAASLYNYAFKNCTSLQQVDLSGLYYCGQGVFSGCTSLTDVTTGADTNIGAYAFENCTALKSITLRGANVGAYAFNGCSKLNKVIFQVEQGKEVLSVSIDSYAFAGCEKLSSVTFESGVSVWSLGHYAFAETALRSFTMPKGILVLGADVLYGTKVETVTIGDDFDFDKLTETGLLFSSVSVELEQGCEKYVLEDGVLYNADKTKLLWVNVGTKTVTVPETVTAIGAYAFAGSTVQSLHIPASVTALGEGAFSDSALSRVTFAPGSAIRQIPAYAFYGSKLAEITVPASVTAIGDQAFGQMTALAHVGFEGNAVTQLGDYVFAGCTALKSIDLPDGITVMGDGTFYDCSALESVTMPSVQELGTVSFYGCENLTTVRFGANATTMGNSWEQTVDDEIVPVYAYTFYGCEKLESVTFGDKITKIEDGVFFGCTGLKKLSLNAVTELGDYVFFGCTALSEVDGLQNVIRIGDYAFYNCNGLKKLDLASARIIGDYAFAIENGGSAYTEISIPVAEQIGAMAFSGGNETTVQIPASLKTMGYGAFSYSKKLEKFTVEEGNAIFFVQDGVLFRFYANDGDVLTRSEWELTAFPGGADWKDKTYTVPDGTTRIGGYAFAGLGKKAPAAVIMPWSLRVVGVSAFYESGILDYTFQSIQAPTLATVYRQDVYELMQEYAEASVTYKVAERSLFYSNFNDLLLYHTDRLGVGSDLTLRYPENGVGYDNYVWSNYFGQKISLGVLTDDDTRKAIEAIEALEDVQTVRQWLSMEVNDSNKKLVEALAEQVKNARRLYNNISDEAQLELLSDEIREKLTEIEELTRELKEMFNISVTINKITYNDGGYKKEYVAGETFSMEGLILTVVYDDYSTELADMSKVSIVNPTGALGIYNWTVTLSYEGETIEIPITVLAASDGDNTGDEGNDDPAPGGDDNGEAPADDGKKSNGIVLICVVSAVVIAAAAVAVVLLRKKSKQTAEPRQDGTEKSDKKKKRLPSGILWWIVALAVIVILAVIGSLTGGEEDPLDNVAAYIHYNANGGFFDDNDENCHIGYASNSYPLDIQYKNNITKGNVAIKERSGYTFVGWYLAQCDANGDPIYEDGAVKLGQAFDFGQRLKDGDDITLYAKWERDEYVSVILAGCDLVDSDGQNYAVGDEIKQMHFDGDELMEFTGKNLLSLSRGAYTFVAYYTDEACTEFVSWPVRKVSGQAEYKIYAKFIEGNWTVVSNKAGAKKMLESLASKDSYYLIADVDMEGQTLSVGSTVDATIEGNGFRIFDFKVEKTAQTENVSMLGTLAATAEIRNLRLEDACLTVKVKPGSTMEIYFLFTEVKDGAKISALQVSGTMEVNAGEEDTILNLQPNQHDIWIVGGAQTVLENGDLTVEARCLIGEETYLYPAQDGTD